MKSQSSSCSPPPVRKRTRGRSVDAGKRDVLGLEQDRPARRQPRRDQVFDHLLLAVDRDRPPAGQLAELDPVALTCELEVNAVMDQPFALQPLADARRVQQIDRALFEHARPQPRSI